MTDERFKTTSELPKGWADIIDTDNNQTLCNIRVEYADNIIRLLNNLYEENEQLRKSLLASVEKNRKLQTVLDELGYIYVGDLK